MLSPTSESSDPTQKSEFQPGLLRLFLEFAKMSLMGFGGVLVFARRAIVDKHRWMTPTEFNEAFALSQFLPGPNVVNLAIIFGSRLRGLAGGVVVFLGLLGPPVVIVSIIAMLYTSYGNAEVLRRVLHGISCAAIGLFIGVAIKMLMPLLARRDILPIAVLIAVFTAIGVMRWPLPYVLLVAVPSSLLVTYAVRRRRAALAGKASHDSKTSPGSSPGASSETSS